MANTNPRYYVLVDTARSQSGIPIPSKLYWYDGRSWKMDKVELMQPVPNAMLYITGDTIKGEETVCYCGLQNVQKRS